MGDAAPRLHVEERHGVIPSVGAEQPSHCHVGDRAVIGVPDLCTVHAVQCSTIQYCSAISTLAAAACADLRAPAWSAEALVVMQPWDTDVLHPGLLILVLNSVKPGVEC